MNNKTTMLVFVIFLAIGLFFVKRSVDKIHQIEQSSRLKVNLTYNVEKDSFVIQHLRQKPIFIEKQDLYTCTYYSIRYEDCEFCFVHNWNIPYSQAESWDYSCTTKMGKSVLIQSTMGFWEHKCSDRVYKQIQEYCLKIE